jgi:FdhD protein
MARGRTARVLTHRYAADGSVTRSPDDLIVEEPLEIRLDEALVATTMRTPGDDFELAVGFCHGDGLLGDAPVLGCRYCGTGSAVESDFNVVTVETGGRAPVPDPRIGVTSSSCGMCGTTALDDLAGRLDPLPADEPISADVAVAVAKAMADRQPLFQATGAVHAAASFDSTGDILLVREDIGRHNAVDKVVGRMVLDHLLPAEGLGLFVSGRASYELVQKAWAAGFGTLVAVSAPSALAVQAARRAELRLLGFARDGGANIYAPVDVD